jgi:hypothetical protein
MLDDVIPLVSSPPRSFSPDNEETPDNIVVVIVVLEVVLKCLLSVVAFA